MVFCGQCGSHIASGMTRCPNCGTVSDVPAEVLTQVDDEALHVDDPTVESPLYGSALQSGYPMYTTPPVYPTSQNGPFTPPEQHKLILRSDGAYDYDAQEASEATSALRPSLYSTYPSPPRSASDPGTLSSSPYNTVAEQTNYPNAAYIPTQGTPNYQANATPANSYGNYPAYPQQYPQPQAVQYAQPIQPAPPVRQARRHRRVPVLLTILLLLVLVLGGLVFSALRYTLVTGNTNGGTTQGTTTTSMTPTDHAKALVQQYYNDINNKNYNEAYYLWQRNANGQSYASFVQGYAQTVHDDLTIGNVVESGSSGTMRVDLTIVATEAVGNKTVQHTYGGYYVVGQVNGTWKILRGYLVRVR